MEFEWIPRKADVNLHKHGVSFAEAATVFGDDLSITVPDPDHSDNEDRCVAIGWSDHRRLLIVSHTNRRNQIWIISTRELTRREHKAYEEENRT